MQRHRPVRYLAVFVSLLFGPSLVQAQAFGLNEIGTCASSRAFAVTGAPCDDASAVFWNPAAITTLKGANILAGVAAIAVDAKFTQDTTFREYEGDAPTAYVPHLFLTWTPGSGALAMNGKAAYGIGVYVPYGLTSQWTDSFPGRFQARKASLQSIYIQPNFAYRVTDKISVGGGPVIGISSVELVQALDLSSQIASAGPPAVRFSQLGIPLRTQFGQAGLKGDATAFGVHLAIFAQPNDRWTLGLRWLSPLEFNYDDADATFTQTNTGIVLPPGNPVCYPAGTNPICGGDPNATVAIDALLGPSFGAGGPLVAQKVTTHITNPSQIQAGVGYTGFQDWTLSLDYAWTGWKRFRELPVMFQGPASTSSRVLIEDYNNTSSVRLGAQRAFTGGAQLRFGLAGAASAAPDETVTPLLPEQDRSYATIGGAYPLTSSLAIEGAYLRIMAPGKRGRIDERSDRDQSASDLNSGRYELSANIFSIGLKASF